MSCKKHATLWLAFSVLSSCAVEINNVRGCSGVNGFSGVGALCQDTLDELHADLTPTEWLDFLYARQAVDVPDPKNPGKMIHLEAKGPAVCFSSKDFQKIKTELEQLCVKVKCSYEQRQLLDKAIDRIDGLQSLATEKSLELPLPQ